jgi:glycine/D-amino acid oxidase-like deaminating enzyme
MAIPCSTGPDGVAPSNSSGVRVIVVGLGIGGLATAIECHRKGHTVIGFDKIPVHTDTRENPSIATTTRYASLRLSNVAQMETYSESRPILPA